MQSLLIEADEYSPKVSFNTEINLFEITGDSFGEDTYNFFKTITNWLKNYLTQNTKPIELNIQMNYMNSSSFKRLNEILGILEEHYVTFKTPIHVIWFAHPDNEETLEYGEDIVEFFDSLPITINFLEAEV